LGNCLSTHTRHSLRKRRARVQQEILNDTMDLHKSW